MKPFILCSAFALAGNAASAGLLKFTCEPEFGDVYQEVFLDTDAPETVTLKLRGGYDMTEDERTHVMKRGVRGYQYFNGTYGFDVDDILNALVWTHEYPDEATTCATPEDVAAIE